jgi:hypothetical protein
LVDARLPDAVLERRSRQRSFARRQPRHPPPRVCGHTPEAGKGTPPCKIYTVHIWLILRGRGHSSRRRTGASTGSRPKVSGSRPCRPRPSGSRPCRPWNRAQVRLRLRHSAHFPSLYDTVCGCGDLTGRGVYTDKQVHEMDLLTLVRVDTPSCRYTPYTYIWRILHSCDGSCDMWLLVACRGWYQIRRNCSADRLKRRSSSIR